MRYSFFIILLLPITLLGQTALNDRGTFSQRIDAKSLAGKKFKLQAALKMQQIDTTAEASILATVYKVNNRRGTFYNMKNKPIKSKGWQTITIEGIVDQDGEYLDFGGQYSRSGIFFFDNFRLFVETSANNFQQISIPDGDFESNNLQRYWLVPKAVGFTVAITAETAFNGKNCIKVDGTELKKLSSFGSNDRVGKYAMVNGVKLYYEEYGKGEPLLLLHGNSLSILSFCLQIPEFSKYYRVISVDTRGHGKSSEDGKTYTYDLFAEDMKYFLDYLKLDRVNILGWSDGGNTGLIMAMKYPQKVKKLITMGANIFIDSTVLRKMAIDGTISQIRRRSGDSSYKAKNSVRLMTMLLTEPKHQFYELKKIQCPVLVMAGEKDDIMIGHTKGIAENIPKGTMVIAPNQSHYFPVENPNSFNTIVLNFLKGRL
jgi:pimeloyl-ACP methyl ester carboxylesterase